jgi:RNA polymerase sigma-70 factor
MSEDEDRMDQAVRDADRWGRETWEGVIVPRDRFAGHCRRVGAGIDELTRNGADLYLACACAEGIAQALRVFERRLLPAIDPYMTRLGIRAAAMDEVRQQLRVRLFAERPRIATYSGRGPLVAWLRIVAVRLAFERGPAPGDASEDADAVGRLVASAGDPELDLTMSRFRERFQRALDESFALLSPRAKTLLRMHYVDGLSIDAMANVYGVHRATVARWLVGIRSTIVAGLRDRLMAEARPTSSDFRSLAAALRDELHISVERILGDGAEDPRRS